MDIDKAELQRIVSDAVNVALLKRKIDEEKEILGHQEYLDLYGDALKQCNQYNYKLNDQVKKHFQEKLIALVKRGYHINHPNWNSEKLILIQIAGNQTTTDL
jgi:hypothetical protein